MDLTRSGFLRRSAVIVFAAVLAGGCTDFSSPPAQLGTLLVSVKDENNAGVGGIPVDLYVAQGMVQWAALSTSADGSGEFRARDGGVLPQSYIVRITVGGQYLLAPGETNDKPVTVVAGESRTVTFKLAKKVIGGP